MLELTNTEEMIMKCLWNLGTDASVADLLGSLKENYGKIYARTTISVFMSYLRDKGYVAYEKKGHAFVYHPLISEQSYQEKLLRNYLEKYFDNSLPGFVEAMLLYTKPDAAECGKIRDILSKYEEGL